MSEHRITARRGYDREELNADNRRKVMDVWKRFESVSYTHLTLPTTPYV